MKAEGYQVISRDFHSAYRLLYLIRAFIEKKLSAKERDELDAWLEESEEHIELFEQLTDDANITNTLAFYEQMREEDALRRVRNRIPFVPPQPKRLTVKLALSMAAVLVLLIGAGTFIYYRFRSQQNPISTIEPPIAKEAETIFPNGNKAILLIEGEGRIDLDSANNGSLAVKNDIELIKSNGSLSYQKTATSVTQAVFHTLITPKGSQYQVTLSDGTKVWLNAASSLKYPDVFTGTERLVELSGEGYFEVQHAIKPFKVKWGAYTVEDLGTAFNINTYKDDGFDKTTLVEGSVKISTASGDKVLKPGEQANIRNDGIDVVRADVAATKGWVNGKFVYTFTPMTTVLKDLERWYNIPVENRHVNTNHFKATIDRHVPLSQMIRILNGTGEINLKWDGTKLIVLP